MIENNRSYILKLYGSESKFEDLRWAAKEYTEMTRMFCDHLYFNENVEYYSTKGLGLLGNQAQRKAKGMIKSKKSNELDNGHKKSVPYLNKELCFANIEKQSTHKHFNYKVWFSLSFGGKGKSRFLFAKRTKPLKKALKEGWVLSDQCEIFLHEETNAWYVQVYVSKKVPVATAKTKSIGVDVGINQITASSEGRLGNSLSKRLKELNKSKKEKQRQLSLAKKRKDTVLVAKLEKNLSKNKKNQKSVIKQLMDKEAKILVARGQVTSSNLVVEDPKVLANLKGNKSLIRWARAYFARRCEVLGKEQGVFVVFVHPAYTSITCPKCDHQDKENRDKAKFCCQKCGFKAHADVVGGVNLARKGQEFVDIYVLKTKPKPLNIKNISKSAVGTASGNVREKI